MFKEDNQAQTYAEVLKRASSFLREIRRSSFVAEWLMRERLTWSKTELIMHYNEEMPVEQIDQFEQDFKQFVAGKPMQHIIGHDWFYHRKFKITSDTLIPRPETEAWLDRVFDLLSADSLKVLDLGTGSGVLGITHKLERPQDEVIATDISEAALNVAKDNARRLEADVVFKWGDLFDPLNQEQFDVVLCNPPYISKNETDVMDQSVLDYEPKEALFAKEDGLAVYKKIAKQLSDYLKSDACVFLEIGYAQGKAVSQLFETAFPKATIEVWQDFSDHDRVVAIFM